MTLPFTTSKAIFKGNGVTTRFPFSFKVWDKTQLALHVTDPKGITCPATGWSVELSTSGGVITYTLESGPLPEGWSLVVLRDMPFTQNVDLITGTRFDPQVIEDAMDMATAERQQLREAMARAVILGPGADETPEELISRLLQAAHDAVAAALAAAASAVTAAADAAAADEASSHACKCASSAEVSRDVALSQNELINTLMAVELAKINALMAANKDDQLAAIAQSRAWATTPHGTPVRLHPHTREPEYSGMHWSEEARRAGLEEATDSKMGLAQFATALDIFNAANNRAITAFQYKQLEKMLEELADCVSTVSGPGLILKADATGNLHAWSLTLQRAVYKVGAFKLSPHSKNELPPGWYPRDGCRYLLSSPQGQALNSLSDAYKTVWSITIEGSGEDATINVPNAFDASGRGYFERPVDGVSRTVGSVELDALQSIDGRFSIESYMNAQGIYDNSLTGPFYSHRPSTGFTYHGAGPQVVGNSAVGFSAARVARTSTETRPSNSGMTPVIFLGVNP